MVLCGRNRATTRFAIVVPLCLVIFCRGAWGQQPTAPSSATPPSTSHLPSNAEQTQARSEPKSNVGSTTATKPTMQSSVVGGVRSIQFVDLALRTDQKLIYGQPFTISGKFEDVCVAGTLQRDKATGSTSCGQNGVKVTDIINVTTVSGKYVVAGLETPFTASQVTGASWNVTVGKLDEGMPVTFSFMFSGKLSQKQAARVANQLLASKDFIASLDQFLDRAANKTDSEQAVFASAFGLVTAQAALDLLGSMHVALTNANSFRKALSLPSPAEVGLFIYMPEVLAGLRELSANDKQMLGFKDSMNISAAYQAIRSELAALRIANPRLKSTAQRLVDTYEALQKQLATDVAAGLLAE
jgi:hypothetical protein